MICRRIFMAVLAAVAIHVSACALTKTATSTPVKKAAWLSQPADSLHFLISPPTFDKEARWVMSDDGRHALSLDGTKIMLWDALLRKPLAVYPASNYGKVRFSKFSPHLIYIKYIDDWWILADVFTGKTRGFFKEHEIPAENGIRPPQAFIDDVCSKKFTLEFSDMDYHPASGRVALAGPYPLIWYLKDGTCSGIPGFSKAPWFDDVTNKDLILISPLLSHRSELGPYNNTRCTFDEKGLLYMSLPGMGVHVFDNTGEYSHSIKTNNLINQLRSYGGHLIAELEHYTPVISIDGKENFKPIRSRSGNSLPFMKISEISDDGHFFGTGNNGKEGFLGQLRSDGTARWKNVRFSGNGVPQRLYMSKSGKWCSYTKGHNSEVYFARIEYGENGLPSYEGLFDRAKYFTRSASPYCGSFVNDSILAIGTVYGEAIFSDIKEFDPMSGVLNENDLTNTALNHYGAVIGIISIDDDRFATADSYGTVRIWHSRSLEPVATMVFFPSTHDYIIYTPDNYYKATRGATDMIHYVKGLDVYSFRQFDLRFNRPDIVLQRLGGDVHEIEILRSAWKKRLRHMGFDESTIAYAHTHAPTLQIANRQDITGAHANGCVDIVINAADSVSDLRSLHVLVNGVPVYGENGMRIHSGNTYRASQRLELASGVNDITVYCMNADGQESLRQQVAVTNDNKPSARNLYVAAVGVSEYDDASRNLRYAASDAGKFVKAIAENNDKFADIKVLTVTDSDFSGATLAKLQDFFSATSRDDLAILYYAGHGILDTNLDYYLGCTATDFSRPESTAVKYSDFQDVLDNVPSLHRYCIVDACHSGDIDKDGYLAANVIPESEFGDLTFRDAGTKVISTVNREVARKYHSMFVDLSQKAGVTVVASSNGDELSVESGIYGGGLFTHVLAEGLSDKGDRNGDGAVSVAEALGYVAKQVPVLSGARQNPQIKYHESDKDVVLK